MTEVTLAGEWRLRGSTIVVEDAIDSSADALDEVLGQWFRAKPKPAVSDAGPPSAAPRPSVPSAPGPQARSTGHVYRPIPSALQVATRDLARARLERLQAGRDLRAAEATIVEKRRALASAQTEPPSVARLGARNPSEYGPLLHRYMEALERAVAAAVEAKRDAESRFNTMTRQLEAAKERYEKERLEAEKREQQRGLAR
jgi:hypothetical protein